MNETANDEIKRLQGCINDLIGVLALPALWKGQDAKHIVKTLLDVLVATLRLDFAYVLLTDPVGGGPIEMVRHDQLRHLAAEPGLVGQTLTQSLGANPRKWPPRAKSPFGEGSLSIVPLGSGRDDEIGVIVAGSERADFPWQTETVVLSVAANQAAMGLASARAYEQERLRTETLAQVDREEWLIETSRLYRELQNRERKIRRLVDANVLGICIWNLDGAIVEANDAFLRMLKYSREDVVSGGLRWTDLTPAEWREGDERGVTELRSTGTIQPFEKEFFRKDGSRVPILIGGALFEDSGSEGVAFVLDQTERKRAEEAVRESERRLRSAIDGIPGFICTLGPNGEVEAVNRPIVEYFGLPLEVLRNWATGGIIHPDDLPRLAERFAQSIAAGVPFETEHRARRFDGEYRWFDVRYVPIRDESGRIARWYVLMTDIEDRKRALARLQQMEADFAHMNRVSMMGELAAWLAHEITQPIGSARNNARAAQNFLKAQPLQLDEVREALACVVGDTDRARDIIDRIRTQMKKAPPRNERFDLSAAINEVIVLAQSVTDRNGVSVQTQLTDGLCPVAGDRVQLQQVLLNLMLNAAEVMGSVGVGARELLISAEQDPAGVLVAVRDSGPGIDPAHLERVFDAFYTTKPSGTGMGLSVCRSIVNAHGGRLWAEANQPRGAVFRFTWPGADVGL